MLFTVSKDDVAWTQDFYESVGITVIHEKTIRINTRTVFTQFKESNEFLVFAFVTDDTTGALSFGVVLKEKISEEREKGMRLANARGTGDDRLFVEFEVNFHELLKNFTIARSVEDGQGAPISSSDRERVAQSDGGQGQR